MLCLYQTQLKVEITKMTSRSELKMLRQRLGETN